MITTQAPSTKYTPFAVAQRSGSVPVSAGPSAYTKPTGNKKARQLRAASPVVQMAPPDYAQYNTNKKVDPDVIGEKKGGIREIDQKAARPDDVPLHQAYRLAMHRLHDSVLIMEALGDAPKGYDPKMIRASMVSVQKRAKQAAKDFKADMRDLSSKTTKEDLQKKYKLRMDRLSIFMIMMLMPIAQWLAKKGLKTPKDVKGVGETLWRQRWLTTKKAVDTAMDAQWGSWKPGLKMLAKYNQGVPSMKPSVWAAQVDKEKWGLYYGGSLMKGYKGPPKQNTRFLASSFDVDANMEAPSIAEYLINVKKKKVDRGQLDPAGVNTGIELMDKAMDKQVKAEMVKAKLVKDTSEADEVVSEPFETRVNATNVGIDASKEVHRSKAEQDARDWLTSVRKDHPERMPFIDWMLKNVGLEKDGSLTPDVLTPDQIVQILVIVKKARKPKSML